MRQAEIDNACSNETDKSPKAYAPITDTGSCVEICWLFKRTNQTYASSHLIQKVQLTGLSTVKLSNIHKTVAPSQDSVRASLRVP